LGRSVLQDLTQINMIIIIIITTTTRFLHNIGTYPLKYMYHILENCNSTCSVQLCVDTTQLYTKHVFLFPMCIPCILFFSFFLIQFLWYGKSTNSEVPPYIIFSIYLLPLSLKSKAIQVTGCGGL
jgi:hypothetical protein